MSPKKLSFSISKATLECLKATPEEKYTARQIAEWIYKTYPEECQKKQERSKAKLHPLDTDAALVQQIIAEIGAQRPLMQEKYPDLKTTDGRPRLYYYSTNSDEEEVAAIENYNPNLHNGTTSYTEHDLYPKLSEFLRVEFNLYSKRVDEKRATNSHGPGGNRWLFPDLVGLEDLSHEWDNEIKECVQCKIADRKTKLWSFEVKKLINKSNVREAYFQAVSNSSWANYGYLVTSEIQKADKELRMLAALHGIGLIKLDIENPAESEIMIPARERIDVDWNAANRLAKENPDFLEFIKLVKQFYKLGEIKIRDWDIPFSNKKFS